MAKLKLKYKLGPISTAAWPPSGLENLDEMVARKSRFATATYDYSYLENGTSLVWQPETLRYKAVEGSLEPYGSGKSGAEVWKMTCGPYHNCYNGLGASYYSANGKWLVFYSRRPSSSYTFPEIGDHCFYIVRSDGRYLQPFATTSAHRNAKAYAPAINWNPAVADEFWITGVNGFGVTGKYTYYLYRHQVSSTGVITAGSTAGVDMVDLSSGGGSQRPHYVDKSISADGLKILATTQGFEEFPSAEDNYGYISATDEANSQVTVTGKTFVAADIGFVLRITDAGTNLVTGDYIISGISGTKAVLSSNCCSGGPGSNGTGMMPKRLHPVTIVHDTSVTCDNPKGYSMDRGQGLSGTQYDAQPQYFCHEHGDAYWFGGNASFGYWAIGIIPSGMNVYWQQKISGTGVDSGPLYSDSGLSGEVLVMMSDTPKPAWTGGYYFGHSSPDVYSRYFAGLCSDPSSPFHFRIKICDTVNQTILAGGANLEYVASGNHYVDWHGFTDWITTGCGTPADPANTQIVIVKYNAAFDAAMKALCRPHNTYVGTGVDYYNTALRVSQSPDGTKVLYPSSFLNSTTNTTDVYSVVAYYPYPPEITGASKNLTNVRIAFDPTCYTSRGWPDEATDDPPEPKEIEHWRVWISTDNATWTEATDGSPIDFATRTYDYAQTNGTTLYYAMTSTEYCGLESRRLGNVWKVTLDGSGNITNGSGAGEEQTDYPASPGDISEFWTTLPADPTGFSATKQATAGHYQLNWTEPSDNKIRHYNVYYGTPGVPDKVQNYRIVSVPVGISTWLDWCADTANHAHYRITSVDRQGNESAGATWSET